MGSRSNHSFLSRLLRRPGFLGTTLFIATMGLAVALAYQAVGAATQQREAAEATLAHHATIAAWRFAREGRSWVGWGMGEAGNKLQHATMGSTLPGPDLLSRVLAEKDCDCMTAGFATTVFRVLPTSKPVFSAVGEPLSERAQDALVAIGREMAGDTAPRVGPRQWRILRPGRPSLNRMTDVAMLWKVGDKARGVRAVYGMIVDSAQISRPLRGAALEARFFPPAFVKSGGADSLVHLVVAGPNGGAPLFTFGPEPGTYVGTDTLGLHFGDMVVTASITPKASPVLLAGGLPPSRYGTILALVALAIGLGVAALLLMRREQRLVKLREDFVSGVSHELRTPLTQIRMLSELLQTDGFKTDSERSRATDVINREAMRLTNLVDNILDFTRLRRSAGGDGHAPVSLADVAREVGDAFAPLLDAHGNRLEIAVGQDARLACERDAVNRVIRNLVENAIKYGPKGQTIRVCIARGEKDTALITVDDEGPGIPRDEWTRIWQPYYRLDRDRNASMGGSGLGLAVVADLTRVLGGRAWVGDAPNKGARFTIELPATADPSLRSG